MLTEKRGCQIGLSGDTRIEEVSIEQRDSMHSA